MRVQVLASSSAGNAVALHEGGSTLLLEAGIKFDDVQRGLGHKVSQLDACLISHEHGDHARCVPNVLRAGVDVWASKGTWNALNLEGHRCKRLTAGELVQIGRWHVLPFDVKHDATEPLGFLIARDGERILYLTDSAYSPYRFNGLTRILIEANYSERILRENVENGRIPRAHMLRVLASHMSIERAVTLLQANDLSKVEEIVLLHLSDGNSNAEEFQQLVARATGKPVYVAAREYGTRLGGVGRIDVSGPSVWCGRGGPVTRAAPTPGPWEECTGADGTGCSCGLVWSIPADAPVASCDTRSEYAPPTVPPLAERQANARLVAASPTMYDALEDAMKRLTNISLLLTGDWDMDSVQRAYNLAYPGKQAAALAKARGGGS